jgi:hypothetical protein
MYTPLGNSVETRAATHNTQHTTHDSHARRRSAQREVSCELAEAEAAAPGPPATTTTHHGSRNKDAWLCLARGGRRSQVRALAERGCCCASQATGHKAHWLAPALAWPFLAAKSGLPPSGLAGAGARQRWGHHQQLVDHDHGSRSRPRGPRAHRALAERAQGEARRRRCEGGRRSA